MPQPSLTVTLNNIGATTREYVMPEVYDNIFTANPILSRFRALNTIEIQGGRDIEFVVEYDSTVTGGSYSGNETLTVTASEFLTRGVLNWKQYYEPVTIDGLSQIQNSGPLAIVDLLAAKFRNASKKMANNMATDLYGDGTGNSNKVLTGFLAANDNGDDVGTYAGIARSTYTWFKGVVDVSNTARALTLALIRSNIGSVTEGNDKPTIMASTVKVYNKVWNLLQANQQFHVISGQAETMPGLAGFTTLAVDNIPLVVDSHAPTEASNRHRLFILNERYLKLVVSEQRNFIQTDFVRPRNADDSTALILMAGNLVGTNPRMQATLEDIDPDL